MVPFTILNMSRLELLKLEDIKYSPLITASLLDILLNSQYNNNGIITIDDIQLERELKSSSISPAKAIQMLSRNKIAITNIHIRTKTGRSNGHKYIIDLHSRQDKSKIYKISDALFPSISTSLLRSTEGAN